MKIRGTKNDDVLSGTARKDTIFGGKGDDVIYGGAKSDKLVGGKGSDVFYFKEADSGSVDKIKDFEIGKDVIIIDTHSGVSAMSMGDDLFIADTFPGTDIVEVNGLRGADLIGGRDFFSI